MPQSSPSSEPKAAIAWPHFSQEQTGPQLILFWFIQFRSWLMWPCYGVLVARIWQPGMGRLSAVTPSGMWAT